MSRTALLSACLCLLSGLGAAAPPAPPARSAPTGLATVAESSGFVRTGRYDEVLRLCDELPARFPGRARCLRFGQTAEGRPMAALVASADGALEPATARARRRPVLLIQGGIHAGEIDGKDALLPLLRDLLQGKAGAGQGVLEALTLVIVPVYNVDGHERFGPNHRPNQIGPAEMGWRTTAQYLNLNRDYVKAEAPETAAMLHLLGEWDPVLYADLHVTDGADFQPDIAVMVEPRRTDGAALRPVAQALSDAVQRRLSAAGHVPLSFYPSFVREGDPSSGFAVGMAPPRFSNAYAAARNRLGVLVETHSWKDYRRRVRATRDAVLALLEEGRLRGAEWLRAAAAADEEAQLLGGQAVPLSWDNTEHTVPLRFPGYAYRLEPSAASGATRIRYDARRPAIWDVPLHDELKPIATAAAPRAGYLVPAAHAALVAEKLRLHGLAFRALPAERTLEVETFRVTEKQFRPYSYEGRQTVQAKGRWRSERRAVPRGSLFVPIAQKGARLVLHLLDPAGPDSLLAWGYFNAHLEQKEFLEPYMAEQVAEQMLARDPALRTEFLRKLAADPAFARDPEARLRFFHERHASWDEQLDLYPVYRLQREP